MHYMQPRKYNAGDYACYIWLNKYSTRIICIFSHMKLYVLMLPLGYNMGAIIEYYIWLTI